MSDTDQSLVQLTFSWEIRQCRNGFVNFCWLFLREETVRASGKSKKLCWISGLTLKHRSIKKRHSCKKLPHQLNFNILSLIGNAITKYTIVSLKWKKPKRVHWSLAQHRFKKMTMEMHLCVMTVLPLNDLYLFAEFQNQMISDSRISLAYDRRDNF